MTAALRIFLLVGAVLVLAFVVLKLKKAEFEVTDSLFWLVAVVLLAVMALFPQWVYALSELPDPSMYTVYRYRHSVI